MRWAALVLTLGIGCLAGAAAVDVVAEAAWRQQVIAASHGDPQVLARRLLAGAKPAPHCGADHATDLDRLMSAIVIVEDFAHSRAWKLAEATLVGALSLAGAPIPDLTLGDGEIRPSTARRAGAGEGPALPLRLLDPCANRQIGVAVLAWIAREHGLADRPLDHAAIVAIAAAYNGQGAPHEPAQLIANATYDEVVYDLYYGLAFRDLAPE